MVTPEMLDKLVVAKADINGIIETIDSELQKEYNLNEYAYDGKIHVILDKEYPKSVRDEIVHRYEKAGWKRVTHKTSSENGERPGLTGITFYSDRWLEEEHNAE